MTAESVRYVRIVVTPEMIHRCAIDVTAHVEEEARRQLLDDPAVQFMSDPPVVRVQWEADLSNLDERGDPVLIDWTPGTPVPAGTSLLLCTAVIRPAGRASEREMPQGPRLEVTG